MVSETPASLVSLVGVFLCYKLDTAHDTAHDIFVTNFGRIFHYNRITTVLMMEIFHYNLHNNPFMLLIFTVMQVITLFFTAFIRV